MKIMLCKNLSGHIIPAFDEDKEKLKFLKYGQPFMADVTVPRNLKFHKKYFALINLVFQNQEQYDNVDILRRDITIDAGFYTEHVDIWGEVRKEAESISFAKMEEHTFSDLYSRTIDSIVRHFHFDRQHLIDEVEQYF